MTVIAKFDHCPRCDAIITDRGRALNCGFCRDGRLFCGRACVTKHAIDAHCAVREAMDEDRATAEAGERALAFHLGEPMPAPAMGTGAEFQGYEFERATFEAWWAENETEGSTRAAAWDAWYARAMKGRKP